MRITLLSENDDCISCQNGQAHGRAEAASVYMKTPPTRETFVSIGIKDQEELLNSVLRSISPRTIPIEPKRMATSAVATLWNIRIPARASQQYQISRDANDFINRQKKAVQYRKDIFIVSDKVSGFLKREGIEAKISIDLFTDPEYSDWVESKIRIEVPADELKRAYGIYNELLSYSLKGIHKKTLKQLLVTIENR